MTKNASCSNAGIPVVGDLARRVDAGGRDIRLFLCAVAVAGFAGSLIDATFNNYLSETFHISSFQRTVIEMPREVPGLIVLIVSALLSFLCNRRLAAVAMWLAAAGLVLMALLTPTFSVMLTWLFLFSVGQHLLIPLNSSIGMELAQEGKTGRRLGQLNSLRNLAAIAGSFFIVLGFRFLHFSFTTSFLCAATGFAVAGFLIYDMRPNPPQPASLQLKLHREYAMFYWLAILYGMRKQIFITFAPWVLVTVYGRPTQAMATLLTIGGVVGVVFQPVLGRAIDALGEKTVLAGEAMILVAVCLLYGFAGSFFSAPVALVVVGSCFVADQMLMSVGMARATYIKKIALHPSHVTPALTAATSIDHVFSISTALICGVVWKTWGYRYVFLIGAGIALINLISTLAMKRPPRPATANAPTG